MTTEADPQNILASLRQWQLEQDNSGRFRVYRDQHGQIYHSVTHILKNTAPQSQKDALSVGHSELAVLWSVTLLVTAAPLLTSTANIFSRPQPSWPRQSANKKGSWKVWDDGLARPPKAITSWALKKAKEGSPQVAWPAREYARGLSDGLVSGTGNGRSCSEFSVSSDEGFAGTADALIDTPLGLTICDFKTTSREADKPEAWLKGSPGPARRLQLAVT